VGSEEVRKIGGHGLGLPLAKDIIELHRGQLSVRSEPGKGSEFMISFWKDSGLLKQAI
jgi:signal transduction histidine kinase